MEYGLQLVTIVKFVKLFADRMFLRGNMSAVATFGFVFRVDGCFSYEPVASSCLRAVDRPEERAEEDPKLLSLAPGAAIHSGVR